jgi:hypothetical protein
VIETFYIYADGSDLAEIAPELRARIEAFVAPYSGRVRVVDQCEERKEESADRPDRDLGVNFEFETLSAVEKKDLLLFFQNLSTEFGRDFVVGGVLPSGLTEDFVSVSAGETLDHAFDLLLAHEKEG